MDSNGAYPQLQEYRLQNPKNVILGHLNFNPLRSKSEAVEAPMQNKSVKVLLLEI